MGGGDDDDGGGGGHGGHGGDDENGKNYDENNDWEKEKVGWTASRFYWHGDGDLMVVMNHNMMITMAKVWWEGS